MAEEACVCETRGEEVFVCETRAEEAFACGTSQDSYPGSSPWASQVSLVPNQGPDPPLTPTPDRTEASSLKDTATEEIDRSSADDESDTGEATRAEQEEEVFVCKTVAEGEFVCENMAEE